MMWEIINKRRSSKDERTEIKLKENEVILNTATSVNKFKSLFVIPVYKWRVVLLITLT